MAAAAPRRSGSIGRSVGAAFASIVVITIVILAVWYVAAVFMNADILAGSDKRKGIERTSSEFVQATWEMERPNLPAPHQVAIEVYDTTVGVACTPVEAAQYLYSGKGTAACKKSLVYHAFVTLSSALAGFGIGTLLGILLAVIVVHVRSLELSLMPWIISSQAVPILALAPILVVVGYNLLTGQLGWPQDTSRFIAKALISTYLSFFPVTVGMVKGLRSPDPVHRDLMRTYSASAWQEFWKLRWPSSLPYLFVSMKIAIAASVVGAIVAELPTGARAGLGARLLTGSYYSQTIQIWSALIVASITAALLVGIVGLAEAIVRRRTGTQS